MADGKCGCGSWTPIWLQKLANPKMFVLNFAILMVYFISGNVILNTAVTTIERQFKLSSLESGVLASVNDVASVCVSILGSYFGYKSHRPRWIATCVFIAGIGNLVCVLPHYLIGPNNRSNLVTREEQNPALLLGKFVCFADQYGFGSTGNNTDNTCQGGERDLSVMIVVIGQIMVGIGLGTVFPLAVTYVEDAVGKTKTLSYMAFAYLGGVLGAGLGLLLTSITNSLYVDFDRLEPDEIPDIPQKDTRWVGAWWLGFAINGILMLVSAVPMFFFPRVMEHEKDIISNLTATKAQDEHDVQVTDILAANKDKGLKETTRGLRPALTRVGSNVTLWFLVLTSACTSAVTSAGSINVPKFLVYHFNYSVSTASLVLVVGIPLPIISHFVSAGIMRRIKHNLKKTALLILLCNVINTFTVVVNLFVQCPTADVAGYSVPYQERPITDTMLPECYADCGCNDEAFFPVCGENGVTYASPCVAGCKSFNFTLGMDGSVTPVYQHCSCLGETTGKSGTAVVGFCEVESNCYMHLVYLAMVFLSLFCLNLTVQPFVYMTLRISDQSDRAVSMGFLNGIPKILGLIPGPIYYGAIINTACRLWQKTCGERGNCYIFDTDKYRHYLNGLSLGIYALAALFASMLWFTLPSTLKKVEKGKSATNIEELKKVEKA